MCTGMQFPLPLRFTVTFAARAARSTKRKRNEPRRAQVYDQECTRAERWFLSISLDMRDHVRAVLAHAGLLARPGSICAATSVRVDIFDCNVQRGP